MSPKYVQSLSLISLMDIPTNFSIDFNPLAAGKIDLRLLQFAQKIVQMVFLTLKILNFIKSLPSFSSLAKK